MVNDRMESKDLAVGVIFILQCSMGILRHFTLLSYYLMLHYNKHTLKPIDLILMNMFIANFLLIFSKSVLQTVEIFGMELFFNVFVCKFLLYIERVGRSVSVATVCLLSVFQAITISPRNSCLNGLKVKVPKYINLSIFFCWPLYFVINMILPVYGCIKWNSNNMTYKRSVKYCFSIGHDELTSSIFTILFVFPEVFLAILIVLSGSSMVVTLYRHKQQVQHIYCNYACTRTSPESRATKSIVVLVSVFICFYSVSSILYGCIALFCDDSWWLINIAHIISLCFPIFGSFLVSHNPALSRFSLSWIKNTRRV
ncbi:vomeronasal type-1 receptor 2 [Rattus norvegicus]|uniref:Vomeronasal type-1 receptor n=1 Tax=Rattus norvegicus TaxID=10116 RepID=Q5J3E9_RAT|nr:vomeronasal type-1 receptor 2 [Rattus norvegicus]|eukprot:NP_001008958.1 vomeronasal 1 receptor 10 [Rattus norvegicus]